MNELGKRKRSGEEMNINELPDEKRGRKLMLGEELDKQVQSYLLYLRCNGAVINSSITIAVAQGIVTNYDSNMLFDNGGHELYTWFCQPLQLTACFLIHYSLSVKVLISHNDLTKLAKRWAILINAYFNHHNA